MKRSVGSLVLATAAAGAFAQGNFTIVRPVDESRVREKVKIQFPKNSVPPGGYVGIFLNGQLIDAMVPQVVGNYRQYILDTKGRGLPDSQAGKPDRLEAKLYAVYNGQPRIVKTSSIDFSIANVASIKVPMGGFKLRYRFAPGTQATYKITQKSVISTISETENGRGGRPAELPLDAETFRMTYAVDNAYPNGDGLLRMQAAPIKGKDYAILTVGGETEPKKFKDVDMAAIYMRLTGTGKEIYGSIPEYYPLEGTSGAGNMLSLFAAFPLPSLPEKAVSPGDSWQSRFQSGKIDMAKLWSQTSVVNTRPARGEFMGVEWEMGHPCAKLHNSIAIAELSDEDKKLAKQGRAFAGKKQKVEETVWFALDTRQVLKVVRDETVETKVDNGGGSSPFGGGPGQAPGGGYSGGGYPGGGRGGPGGRGGMGPGRGDGDRATGSTRFNLQETMSGSAGPGQGRPGSMMGGGRMSGGSTIPNTAQYIRVQTQQIYVLEQ